MLAALAAAAAPPVECTGTGALTVVLEASAETPASDLVRIRDAVRERVCVYERAGHDGALRATLAAAGEKPPYVLVTAATGTVDAWSFARTHADEVAGLVLVDPPTDARSPSTSEPLGDRPLVVLTRGTLALRRSVAEHARLAALSTRSRHTVVAGAGPNISLDAPRAVIAAIGDVVEAAASGKTFTRAADASLVDAAARTVSFATEDGGTVCGDLYGSGARGVVLAHGGRFNKESWATQGRALAEAGFHVLAVDLRGYGCSRGRGDAEPMNAPLHFDVAAAVEYLRKAGAKTVSAIGGSMGGDPAAAVALRAGAIHRLVLLGSTPGGDPRQLKAPVLFIMARDDANDDGPRLPGLRAYYDKAPEPKELMLLDGSAHAQFLFETEHAERVMREIQRFLSAP
jgi:pimeloyl-ACP methyl ester carboxylesterase